MNRILLACIALALPSFVAAESIPGTPATVHSLLNGMNQLYVGTENSPTAQAACEKWPSLHPPGMYWSAMVSCFMGGCSLYRTNDNGMVGCAYIAQHTHYACPATGGWVLSGATCYRPDCLNWQVRQADGACGNPSCGGCAVFNTTTHLCDNTCFLPRKCMVVEGGTQCSTPDGVCQLR